MAQSEKTRQGFRLPRLLADRLAAAAGRGATKSAIVADALNAWFARSGDDELELRFARRLNRISTQLGRIERNSHVDIESQAIFFRYMLTVNAPIAEEDEAARALGRDRFKAFIQEVGHQLAKGRQTFGDEGEDEK